MSSSDLCANDCSDPFVFPKPLYNRPGLSHIDYKIGTYSDFRRTLFKKLDSDPNFSNWTYQGSDDPGIALLEGVSILGDILTFYQELYANEKYLRTATRRESIADLVRLLGYRLSPGVGGKGTFAVKVKGDKPVVIPKGAQIKAQLEGMPQQSEFFTSEEVTVYPSMNEFNLYMPSIPSSDLTEFYVSSPIGYTLKKGDRLMVGILKTTQTEIDYLDNYQIVLVDEVYQSPQGSQIFKIKGKLSMYQNETVAYKLGRSFHHFGHNSPPNIVSIDNNTHQACSQSATYTRSVNAQTTINTNDPTDLEKKDYPLDEQINDLVVGNKLLIQGEFFKGDDPQVTSSYVFLREIDNIKSISMRWCALTGSTTIVSIRELTPTNGLDTVDIRKIAIHEVIGEPLEIEPKKVNISTLKEGTDLYFYGNQKDAAMLKDKQLILVISPEKNLIVTVNSVSTLTQSYLIKLDTTINYTDFDNDKPTSKVYGNLVEANQGKIEKDEILGNGDARQKFQTFKLPKTPLTYLFHSDQTPPQVPELQVYVNDRLWERIDSFFGREYNEQIYVVREDSNGESWVQFGDGKTGARLPSGLNNVSIKYKTGIGASGPLKNGTTVQLGTNIEGVDKIQLFTGISGGNQAETGDNAKKAAPGKVQGLDRIVSLEDFETEILTIGGGEIAKVSAEWGGLNKKEKLPCVALTVLKYGQDENFDYIKNKITSYNYSHGLNNFPVMVYRGFFQYVYLDVKYGFDSTFLKEKVEGAIKQALGVEVNGMGDSKGLFDISRQKFGGTEHVYRIEGIIQQVLGVVWVEVNYFDLLDPKSDKDAKPDDLTIPNPKVFSQNVTCRKNQILGLYKKHLTLSGTAVSITTVSSIGDA